MKKMYFLGTIMVVLFLCPIVYKLGYSKEKAKVISVQQGKITLETEDGFRYTSDIEDPTQFDQGMKVICEFKWGRLNSVEPGKRFGTIYEIKGTEVTIEYNGNLWVFYDDEEFYSVGDRVCFVIKQGKIEEVY